MTVEKQTATKDKAGTKPGYDSPVVRNPHKDMLASITTIDGNEVATWFHKGKHVFTVTTFADGTMKYRSAI